MDKVTKEELNNTILDIINDTSLEKDDIIKRIGSLIPSQNNHNKCPKIPSEELKEGIETLIDSFWLFVEEEDISLLSDSNSVDINQRNLAEVISRTYKRKEYYKYFHNITNVSELKETALLCFWIIKLKPFTVLIDRSPLRPSANEKFALNLILSQIQHLLSLQGEDFRMLDDCFIQDTLYAFKYRDLSKEAMILYVDSIANAYGITIDSWK